MSQEPTSSGRRRTVGDALGGFARRVGELLGEVSGQAPLPEGLREGLDRARMLRLGGATDQAAGVLRGMPDAALAHPMARFAFGLGHIHDGLRGGRPLRALTEIADELTDTLGPAPLQLIRAAHAVFSDHNEAALDELRRAARDPGRLLDGEAEEARFLIHLLASLSHFALGHEERTLRELQKARARLPAEAGNYLRSVVLVRGVEHLLAADQLSDAAAWVNEALELDPHDRDAAELRVRVMASRGDRTAAIAALAALGDSPESDITRLWVALTVGLEDPREDARMIAIRLLQTAPEDPQRRRWWALAELKRIGHDPDAPIDPSTRREVIESLARATERAPMAARDRHLQELAHAALRLDLFPESARSQITARFRSDAATAPEELRLVRARIRLADGDDSDLEGDFAAGAPPRFRADPDIGGPWGPDPISPVRSVDTRNAVLAAQRALTGAELALRRGHVSDARDLLVESLVEWPALSRARSLLAELVHPPGSRRLEDLLGEATALLAAVPNRLLGVELSEVPRALSQVIAARERLVRPLTIAIMGEFSAGKSTFVNALLGEAVAPMGVLPTTTTINVFRRGPSGSARVHYRDDHVETLTAEEVPKFLHSLDTTAAAAIRHVEIERTGPRMGDASVVDTPGLNALDPFHEQVAREFIDQADAVIWLFSATRSGAASEVGLLASLRAGGRQVLGVLNKVDTLDAAEQRELTDYLRQQLGEVLVDVIPVRAREALEHRTGNSVGEDSFAAVEAALERHFLTRARELKRALTTRRLSEALSAARAAVVAAAEQLEQRADAITRADDRRLDAAGVLGRFADALYEGVLAIDDLMLREGLALGLLRTGKGSTKGPLDPQDASYLAACFRDGILAALQRALLAVVKHDLATTEVLDREFVPWAQGHIEGLVAAGFLTNLLSGPGERIVEGENAARQAFRGALDALASAWANHARGLVRAVDQVRGRAARTGRSAPRTEALRLRSTVVASIDALAQAAREGAT